MTVLPVFLKRLMAKFTQFQFDWSVAPPRETEGTLAGAERVGSELVAKPNGDGLALPVALLARRVASLLEAQSKSVFNNHTLNQLAGESFGSSAGHARDLYDAAEAGMNICIARAALDLVDVPGSAEVLLALQDRMPRQTRRDVTQVELQQFSTPPAEALLVVSAAAICTGMNVLEPSAGTGSLAVLARLAGATVDTNEIDPRRRGLLELQGFRPTAFDAERLDNLLPPDRLYDAIVMNPPFSATGGRVNGHNVEFGARHVEQALLRLKPGGRLVAVVGRGMALDRPKFQAWWADIKDRFRVRANIGIDGNAYSKFGTTFDNQIIVIDHDGSTTDPSTIVTGTRLTLHQAWVQLEEISQEDVYGRIRRFDSSSGGGRTSIPDQAGVPARSGSVGGADCTPSGRVGLTGECGELRDVRNLDHLESPASGTTASGASRHECDARMGETAAPEERRNDAELGSASGGQHAGAPEHCVASPGEPQQSHLLRIEEGSVYAAYRVQKARVHGTESHPANVVESTAMASVEPPDVQYRHALPGDVVREGWVSDIQLEDVIYAGQATESLLPDGSRRGHWNGDGTGIGKGREIYAFIYDQLQRGRSRHVHISASHQLVADAERDRDAVGLPLRIIHQARSKHSDVIQADSGVLFTTYTLLSIDFDGERPRFKQLVDWLGPEFDGVIAFDEAHLMKNAAATPHGGKATVDEGTLRGNMGIALQRMFPQARVRYFSATGATEARHMAPYERLGLWGDGAPFPDFSAFLVAMERGGVAAMEMLCRDLKSVGTYLSRTISYGPTRRTDGTIVPDSAVEYEPLLHKMTDDERRQYDVIADLWSELLVAFESAEQHAHQKRNAHRYAQFYAAQQRFFLQLMLAYSLPDVIPAIRADLNAGRSVVLSLFNTGEAQADRKVRDARAQGVELSELDATPREMIVQLIETQFPLFQYREQTDPLTGNVVSVRVLDAAGNPEINREIPASSEGIAGESRRPGLSAQSDGRACFPLWCAERRGNQRPDTPVGERQVRPTETAWRSAAPA
ncbi:hypothetical protein RAS1_07820 [Phycisphaerae bacterium RAS1]|nr:hypothetical protein RAS1_07820 [Phycisphaerae bacterium RAS1]